MKSLTATLVIVFLALACRSGAAASNADDTGFISAWGLSPNRAWIGADYWANRLQDWTIRGGRAQCTEAEPRFPFRTLHLLTRSTIAEGDGYTISVRIGAQGTVGADAWRGVLIGAGGQHVDYRLSAQVHHQPAEDGGVMVLVDQHGRVMLRDNSIPVKGGGGGWSIRGPVAPDAVPVLAMGTEVATPPTDDIELTITVGRLNNAWTLSAQSADAVNGNRLSSITHADVPAHQVDGTIALVSHIAHASFQHLMLSGDSVRRHDGRAYGPVLCTQYTLHDNTLKLTAQMGPLGRNDTQEATLEIRDDAGNWNAVARARLVQDSFTFPFRVDGWELRRDRRFRVVYDLARQVDLRAQRTMYHGIIRAEPTDDEFVIASLNCAKVYTGGLKWNHNGIWFPHAEVADALRSHDPDLLFFAGDQIYEGDLDPVHVRPIETGIKDYLYKWYRWCWSFEGVTRDRPTVTIPDDHDVYHGNLWAAGGTFAHARDGLTAQDAGGYKMPPRFVNAVHRTQTSHLPDAYDPAPIGNGYSTYYTTMNYAGLSFAILADRQFKSSPSVMLPEGNVKNGWPQDPEWDATTQSDVEGAVLLGERQLEMLRDWSIDFSDDVWMKVVLSQTPFSNIATIPEGAMNGSVIPSLPYLDPGQYPANYKLAADGDSNAWPQTGRNKALREFRRAGAIHLAGDQHLASLIHYGIDDWRDAGMAFCSPAISNTWPRRWYPPTPGGDRELDAPPYTGDFFDGFGNRMSVYAVANPVRSGREPANLYDRMPGYGIVKVKRSDRTIRFECWPRGIDPKAPDAWQYPGWPRVALQSDQRGKPTGWLPDVYLDGFFGYVVEVFDESTGEVESVHGNGMPRVELRTYGEGPYRVRVGTGDAWFKEWSNLGRGDAKGRDLRVTSLDLTKQWKEQP